jgi:uncharacterized protein with PIN domain
VNRELGLWIHHFTTAKKKATVERKRLEAEERLAKRQRLEEATPFNRAERAEKQAAKLAADKLEIENNLAECASSKHAEEKMRAEAAKEAADKLAAGTNCTKCDSSSKNESKWNDMFECLVRYIEEIRETATRHMNEDQKAAWKARRHCYVTSIIGRGGVVAVDRSPLPKLPDPSRVTYSSWHWLT